MRPHPTELEQPICLAGLSLCTSNAQEADPSTARIPDLWGRFFSEGHAARSEGRTRYGVYTDYESDVNGPYMMLVGAEVDGSAAPGLTQTTIPRGRYLTFISPGALPDAVISGWQQVWAYFEHPDAPARAYTTDYEEYDPLIPDEVRIHIAIK